MTIRTTLACTALLVATGLVAGFTPQAAQTPAAGAPPAGPSTFTVDAVHSTAIFRVHHLGAGQFYGRFNDVTGSFTFGEGVDPTFHVTIATESVDTNNDQLDKHLKSPDFFNVREYETMSFKSTAVTRVSPTAFDVTGDLTIHGVTKPVTTRMEWTGTSDTRMGHRCGFEATFVIDRGEFGVMYGLDNGLLGRETRVIVSLEGVRE